MSSCLHILEFAAYQKVVLLTLYAHYTGNFDDLTRRLNFILHCQKPSWEKAAKQIKERYANILSLDEESVVLLFSYNFLAFRRYDPEMDGRVILAKVDCTQEADLCRKYVPSYLIFFHLDFFICYSIRHSLESSVSSLTYSHNFPLQMISRNHIQGYPSIRIFRQGSDLR